MEQKMEEIDVIQGSSLFAMTWETLSHKDVCSLNCFLSLTQSSPTDSHHQSIEV